MMKLFYAPGACSLGIHVLLEEIGAPFEPVRVNLREGEQHQPGFQAVNPKGKVPALVREDGSTLTEFPAIAFHLAATYPQATMMPGASAEVTRALEATDYAVATVHMQGFSRIFRPANFAPSESDHEAVKAKGMEIFTKGLHVLDKALEGRDFFAGAYSFGDMAPFYICFWGADRLKLELPSRLAAHYAAMRARPAVQRVMEREGIA